MSDVAERYEAEAGAFYEATGVMAPGKDVPAAMGGYDADELRHKLWQMWARAVYAERERESMADRIRELEAQQPTGEPVAEHVAWLRYVDWPNGQTSIRVCDSDDEGAFKVYAHPRPRVGVTRELVSNAIRETNGRDDVEWASEIADYINSALPLADEAAPGVVELDEWRVVTKDGAEDVYSRYASESEATRSLPLRDQARKRNAPHRVMRVCLQPLANGGGEVGP